MTNPASLLTSSMVYDAYGSTFFLTPITVFPSNSPASLIVLTDLLVVIVLLRPTAGVTCAGRLSCARHNSLLLRLPGLAQYGSNATLAMVLAKITLLLIRTSKF